MKIMLAEALEAVECLRGNWYKTSYLLKVKGE
jgi:hypothetical protein